MPAKLHVLIIDDDALSAEVLDNLLQNIGLEATPVIDAGQVLPIIDASPTIDLVFLDLEMPIIDGFTLLADLRTQPKLQRAPIIAHTVHTNEMRRAYDVGFDGFIGKPVEQERFAEQIERILDGEAVWEVNI